MKYLLLFVILFGCIEAMAKKQCFLSYDQSQTLFVDCRIGPKPPEYTRVCRMVDGERDGSLYDVKIIKGQNLGLIDRARDFLGLEVESMRDWAPGETLNPDERILCRVDQNKKQAKIDLREAKEAARKTKEKNDRDAWTVACAKKEIHSLICKERGL